MYSYGDTSLELKALTLSYLVHFQDVHRDAGWEKDSDAADTRTHSRERSSILRGRKCSRRVACPSGERTVTGSLVDALNPKP